jgi:predicted acyltransferase
MSSEERKRYLSIDVFRGLTIAVMVFVNFVGEFPNTPSWSKHAPDIGLTYVDLVAPFFIFAISLTYKKSYDHYQKKLGGLENFLRHFRRYVTLIGMGMFTELTLTSTGFYFRWAALQAIGFAGLFSYLFIRFSKRVRLIIACIISILYTALLETTIIVDGTPIKISDLNLLDVHGGVIGAIGFGLILLLEPLYQNHSKLKK